MDNNTEQATGKEVCGKRLPWIGALFTPKTISQIEADHWLERYPALRSGCGLGGLVDRLQAAGGSDLPTFRRRLLMRVVYGPRDADGLARCAEADVFDDAGLSVGQAHSNKIKAIELLSDFTTYVLRGAVLHDHEYGDVATSRKARRMDPCLDAIDAALVARRHNGEFKGGPRINFGTLKTHNKSRHAATLKAERETVMSKIGQLPAAMPARTLIEALAVPQNGVQRLVTANLDAARAVALSLPPGPTGSTAARDRALAVIDLLEEGTHLTIGYHPVGGSDRVFGHPLQTVPREVRRALYAGAWDFDFSTCHMRILAALGGNSDLLAALDEPGWSPWAELVATVSPGTSKQGDPERYEQIKAELKDSLYSAQYAMTPQNLRKQVTRQCAALGLDGAAPKRFAGSWLIKEIQTTQKKMIKAMKEEGGIRDAWGSWLPWEEKLDEKGKRRGNERHLLSRVCQSYETRLITEVAKASGDDFRIDLYCFDGAIISFSDARPDRVARVQARINEMIATRSREWLGAVIPCEWSLLGGAAPAALPVPAPAAVLS